MAKATQGSRFVVDLGSLELSEPDRRAIAAAIQGAVLSHLGRNSIAQKESLSLLDDEGIAGMSPLKAARK